MKNIKVNKGGILQTKGEPSTKAFVVLSGLLRSYSIDEKGKEHIFMFGPEGWIVSDATLPGEPAALFIDALEDSEIQVLEKSFGHKVVDLYPLFKRLSVLQKRVLMLMGASAKERYEHFVDTYPDIIQRVPQRMIASYIGITPEALSKLRSDMAKNNV